MFSLDYSGGAVGNPCTVSMVMVGEMAPWTQRVRIGNAEDGRKVEPGLPLLRIQQVAFPTAAHRGTEILESLSMLGNKTAVCCDSQEGAFLECTKSWVSSQHKERGKEGRKE